MFGHNSPVPSLPVSCPLMPCPPVLVPSSPMPNPSVPCPSPRPSPPVPSPTPRNTRSCSCPTPSLFELQGERREMTELGYSGRCRRQPPKTHGPCSGPLVAKNLVYGPGPESSWGDRATSPPRFNTYSRGSTHLGATRSAQGICLLFGSLTVGTLLSEA
jgi:hypothetical protein